VGFDVLTTCQPSTVWWSGKTASGGCSDGQGSSEPVAPRILFYFFILLVTGRKYQAIIHEMKM
jgi:hypothetical protein